MLDEELDEADWIMVVPREHQAPVALAPKEPGYVELPVDGLLSLEHQVSVALGPEVPGDLESPTAGLAVPMGGNACGTDRT